MKDVIHIDGATAARYSAAGMLPWNVKPFFGIISDAVPLLGLRRTSYFFLGGVFGVLAYLGNGLLLPTGAGIVLGLIAFNLSIAMPDVMIDAVCAEQSKKKPDHASDLQCLSWGSFAIGGLISSVSSGMLVDWLGPQMLFLIGIVCPAGVVIAGGMRLLPEERIPYAERRVDLSWCVQHRELLLLAVYMCVVSAVLSIMQTLSDDVMTRAITTVAAGVVLIFGVYFILRRIAVVLAKVAVFILLRECLQPSTGEAMFQWLTSYPDGPQFSPTVLGWIDIFGYFGLLAGLTLYNKYASNISYRKIFMLAQVFYAFSNLFDYVLVKRWNIAIGIPDIVMLIGDDAVTSAMSRFCAMPMFVLASKVCPDNVEATLFALLMSLSNFGASVGSLVGVSVLEFAGVVDDNYDNLADVILWKSLSRLLPLLIIPLLVPNLTPSDPIITETQTTTAGADEGSSSSLEADPEADAGKLVAAESQGTDSTTSDACQTASPMDGLSSSGSGGISNDSVPEGHHADP